jgi:3-oxoacyl-[acyl-carrier protein] reductase
VVAAQPVCDELVAGLRERGMTVCAAATTAELAEPSEVDALVWALAAPGSGKPRRLESIDPSQWQSLAEQPLREFIEFMQFAHRALRDRGGKLIVVVPTIAMTGAAGLAPWAAVADAQRALVKSAARVWGGAGITVNCVAVPAALLADGSGGDDLSRPDLQQSALPDPDLRRSVAGAIAVLVSSDAAAMTGATVSVDGGRWMNP